MTDQERRRHVIAKWWDQSKVNKESGDSFVSGGDATVLETLIDQAFAAIRAESPLHWTTTLPTKVGRYWYRAHSLEPDVVLVYDDGNDNGWLEVDGVPVGEFSQHTGSAQCGEQIEWAGPIEVPQ